MSDPVDDFIRRAARRLPATTEQPRDSGGRFAGGLAGGAGRGARREPQGDENALVDQEIRAAAGRAPWPTTVAMNGLRV